MKKKHQISFLNFNEYTIAPFIDKYKIILQRTHINHTLTLFHYLCVFYIFTRTYLVIQFYKTHHFHILIT